MGRRARTLSDGDATCELHVYRRTSGEPFDCPEAQSEMQSRSRPNCMRCRNVVQAASLRRNIARSFQRQPSVEKRTNAQTTERQLAPRTQSDEAGANRKPLIRVAQPRHISDKRINKLSPSVQQSSFVGVCLSKGQNVAEKQTKRSAAAFFDRSLVALELAAESREFMSSISAIALPSKCHCMPAAS